MSFPLQNVIDALMRAIGSFVQLIECLIVRVDASPQDGKILADRIVRGDGAGNGRHDGPDQAANLCGFHGSPCNRFQGFGEPSDDGIHAALRLARG